MTDRYKRKPHRSDRFNSVRAWQFRGREGLVPPDWLDPFVQVAPEFNVCWMIGANGGRVGTLHIGDWVVCNEHGEMVNMTQSQFAQEFDRDDTTTTDVPGTTAAADVGSPVPETRGHDADHGHTGTGASVVSGDAGRGSDGSSTQDTDTGGPAASGD